MSSHQNPNVGAVLGMGAVLIVLAVTGGMYRWGGSEPVLDLTIRFWVPSSDAVRLNIAGDQTLLKAHPPLEVETQLEVALQQFHSLEKKAPAGGADEALRASMTALEQHALSLYRSKGREAYRAAGLRFWQRYARALQGGEAAASEVLALGGSMRREALRSGLLQDSGEIESGGWLVLRFLYMRRWAALVQEEVPADLLMTGLERKTLAKWKAEAHADMASPGLERRLTYVAQAQLLDPEYPSNYVRGILFARYGLLDRALPWLERAARDEPANEELRSSLRYLRQRLEK